MSQAMFKRGDAVIYRVTKRSPRPGPRAERVDPEPLGEDYTYTVDKFWRVDAVQDGGLLRVRTRTGKIRVIAQDSPNLRRPRWWESLLHRRRFPDIALISYEATADSTPV